MKKLIYSIVLLLLVCLASQEANAQYSSRRSNRAAMRAKSREMSRFTVKRSFGKSKQYASVGAFFGASNYFGDLAPRTGKISTSLALTRTYFGGFYAKRINANIGWRLGLAWARLRGDDFNANRSSTEGEYRYMRNLNFRNDVIELSFCGTVDILPTDRGYLRRNFLNGYGLLGFEMFYHNPKGYVPTGLGLPHEGEWIALQPLGTEGQGLSGYKKPYSRIQPGIILGGGVKYRVADKIDVGLEFGWRFTFTDYLDDVSGNYVKDADAQAAGKDNLWYVMSNKSGLQNGGGSDEARDLNPEFFTGYEYGGTTWPGPTSNTIRRIKGYGVHDDTNPKTGEVTTQTGSPRGLKALDGYTVTTLTGTYILEFRARTPKFR